MDERRISVTEFVRGMAWHDVGKPFQLGTGAKTDDKGHIRKGHIWIGYWLLLRAGYEAEALVALTHGSLSEAVLTSWFSHQRQPLPAILLLANSLDRISASIYSLLSRDIKDPPFHSLQNPFSRLPMENRELGGRFIIWQADRVAQLDEALRDQFIASLPDSWKPHISRADLDAATLPEGALPATPAPANGRVLLRTLELFLRHYPERTYPPANDTVLMEHGWLSAALAFVLYRNLERHSPDWLSKRIWNEGGVVVLGNEGDTTEINTYLDKGAWNEAQRIACAHLDARLVRVAFEGHRELFESAVRVDDLLGARALTQRFLNAYESALARVLGVRGLVWKSEEDDRLSLLTLNRSQFDLFYLCPPRPDPKGEMTIGEVLDLAYEQALRTVVKGLIADLERDFRRAVQAGKLTFGPVEAQMLRRQLRALGYRLRILDLAVPSPDEVPTFAAFTSRYGEALVEKFREGQTYSIVPMGDVAAQRGGEEDDAKLSPEETCDVCGNHPVFQPFASLLEDEVWRPYVQKVIHHFRGEPERPCLSCIARRILAHGEVAREMGDLLQRMVVWADAEAERPRRLVAVQPEIGPVLPPALASSVKLEGDDDFADLGAAFARYHRRADGSADRQALPDLFPTVSYAADATGNVVLLALQPTEAFYGSYDYTEAVICASKVPEGIKKRKLHRATDLERWKASFVLTLQRACDYQSRGLVENIITIRPHLARVMERIRHLRTFYRALKEALEEEPLRVLPLDVDFPALRLLLPADELDKALRVLDRVMTESLFSATYFEDPRERRRLHELLELLVPDLLHGAVVLFKQKFPLYLALEAERALFHHLAATDARKETSNRPSRSDWYGLRLAFTDLRGTLSQVGPVLAELTYADLGKVLDLVDSIRGVDRRTVLLRAETAEYISTELADALTVIRANRIGLSQEKAQALGEKETFPPVLFLKRAVRG